MHGRVGSGTEITNTSANMIIVNVFVCPNYIIHIHIRHTLLEICIALLSDDTLNECSFFCLNKERKGYCLNKERKGYC